MRFYASLDSTSHDDFEGPLTLSYIPTGCGAEVIWQQVRGRSCIEGLRPYHPRQTLSKSGVPISEDSVSALRLDLGS